MMACTPAESQNVVPLMSTINTGAPRLAADASARWISWAFATSISAGIATAACRPIHRTSQSSADMSTAYLAAWRHRMRRAMSSRAAWLPTIAAITAPQAASGGCGVTAWHSRDRLWSIGRSRRSIRPSV